MGETVGGKSSEVSRVFSKDPLMNSEHFDTNLMGAADCSYMVSAKKPAKKWILRRLKLPNHSTFLRVVAMKCFGMGVCIRAILDKPKR